MSRSRSIRLGGLGLALALVGLVVAPAVGAQQTGHVRGPRLSNATPTAATPKALLKARTTTMPYRHAQSAQALKSSSALATTIQTWNGTVGPAVQDGNTYPFTLVGKDVTSNTGSTTIKTFVIPVTVTFSGTGDVYDPTVTNGACGETQSPLTGALNGPIFKKHNYKAGTTLIGKTQYIDSLQRGQFWQFTNPSGVNPNYHVLLNGTAPVSVNVTATGFPEYSPGTCQALGELDIGTWDSYLQSSLFPALAPYGVKPTMFPVFLFKNVIWYNGSTSNCCILGYHSAFNNPNFNNHAQTYGNADYDSTGDFGAAAQDTTILSHEVAEWADDPYVNNPTPAWGHLGQVSGCQANLENGDPLTGTTFPVAVGGVQYHLQELAYFGWFFGYNGGVKQRYSTRGTFKSPSTLCS